MHPRGQFSRGGGGGAGGGENPNYRRGRRFQFVRSRVSPSRSNNNNSQQSQHNEHPQHQHQHQHHHQQQQQQHQNQQQNQQLNQRNQRNSIQNDLDEIKELCCRLGEELKLVKDSVDEIASAMEQIQQPAGDKRRKPKVVKKPAGPVVVAPGVAAVGVAGDVKISAKGPKPKRLNRREAKERNKTLAKPNDDSTTQAADPSSEDKNDDDGGERHRVYRRKKQHFGRRGQYNNRRRRMDSSNDTSPQNEKSYPQLSEGELNEAVQKLKGDFLAGEIGPVKKLIDDKGPVLAKEFASSILDHAMCDVTSPAKLSDIATSMFHMITSDNGLINEGFYQALSDVSKREDDIAIDAPRYMDTLGQVLGQCLAPMNTGRHKQLLKRFLNKCLDSYSQQSRAQFLASIIRGIANHKSDRYAKEIWDLANLRWNNYLSEDKDLEEFLESQDVKFTTKTFSPEPRKTKKTPEELEKFADDVTDLVEKRCASESLEDLVKDLELEADEKVEYIATLIYGIVRGCLSTDSGDYKLNSEALAKYSSLLNGKQHSGMQKQELDAIALHALTALTKLWHHYNCPQNLMSTILLALHGHGAASYDSLKTWLNSEDLKNTPGIGAARLTSKRCIDDLGTVCG